MKISKRIKFSIIFAILAVLAVILFPILNFSFADALIEGVSGNQYILTGIVGNNPSHYFVNDNGESTLQNTTVTNSGQTHYSIVPTDDDERYYQGWGEVALTSDINELIKKGLVYAQALATVTSNNHNSQSNIKITLSQGDSSVSAVSNNTRNQTSQITTELLQLKTDTSRIRFAFETVGNGTDEKSDFVMAMPTIRLYTFIDTVYLNNIDQVVTPGQTIKLHAYNDVTNVTNVNGNFISYSKVNHQIKYNFLSGGEYVSVVGDNLFLASSIPDGTQIRFQAYCYANSMNSDLIYSENIVSLTVNATKVNLEIFTDFENPGTIIGEGFYSSGDIITLNVASVNPGFTFNGWYINDILQTTKNRLSRYVVTAGDKIYAKFTKTISIGALEVVGRVYDGTTDIHEQDIIYHFNGIEEGHSLTLEGISVKFANANAGTNKAIDITYGQVVLSGPNSDIYSLSSVIIPQSYGTIYPREAEIYPLVNSKQYGYNDGSLDYVALNVVSGESISGYLSRVAGEEVGAYEYTLGTLGTSNPNYTFTLVDNGARFIIEKRALSLANIYVEDKEYDKTTTATINASLGNVLDNEQVYVSIQGNFVSADVGYDIEVVIDTNSVVLYGKDKDNYILQNLPSSLNGNIIPKEVVVTATDVSAFYGEEISYNYTVEGLIDGDTLVCNLGISGTNAGQYDISLLGFSNSNYSINFISAKCNILPRALTVIANSSSKIYGDGDPELSYQTDGLLAGDRLEGVLLRESGENIGEYDILLGTLNNPNYTITFTSNSFTIRKRILQVNVSFKDKVYDATDEIDYVVNFDNNILQDEFTVNIEANSDGINSGEQGVSYRFISIDGDNIANYDFEYHYLNETITIERRSVQVSVDSLSKTYGQDDPAITYTVDNIIDGEQLVGQIKRNDGEDVGLYTYYLDTLNNANNPNYNISLSPVGIFTIEPKNIVIATTQTQKIYGDEDPSFDVSVAFDGQLCFDDMEEEILDGYLTREAGENVGIYNFNVENVSTSINYTFSMEEGCIFVINKRPVTVLCDPALKIYGDDDPQFTYQAENLVDGEVLYLDIRREYGENVGKYQLILSNSTDPRYTITFNSNYLEIIPSDITVKAESKVKIYGDQDPSFTVIVTGGLLKNNDTISQVSQGEMKREDGEDVGQYMICQGSFSFGENYNLTFESDYMQIAKEELTVTANSTFKSYGDADPVIGFQLTSGQLKFDDTFIGALSREEGEELGFYQITIGSLTVNQNYEINLTTNTFEIQKRKIEIIPTVLSKHYGDDEPTITYEIIGGLIGDDVLTGELYRESGANSENVGIYQILSSLSNSNYDITFGQYFFEITPKPITIRADDITITYGEQEPQLTYQITDGELIGEDKISGSLYRIPGNNVGSYAIRSSLNLGRNYSLTFINGTFTIEALRLEIHVDNYEKEYGQFEPEFNYSITSGQIINGDVLHGSITREEGETVGSYKLQCNLYNNNYIIVMNEAYLTIKPKDVTLVASIYDKVYDGTPVAYLRNPYVTGLLDEDVVLLYDRENCARFEDSEIGNNKKVYLTNINLFGTNASNYHLIMPQYLTASITNATLMANEVLLSSQQQAILYDGLNLHYIKTEIDNSDIKINSHKSLLEYDIWLEEDENVTTQINATVTITVAVPEEILSYNNIYVYIVDEDGEQTLVASQKDGNGNLVITTSNLGSFIITTDNDNWIDYGAYIAIGLVVAIAITVAIFMAIKKRKKQKP